MKEKDATKRREWVKNAAIIFLAVMLVLTFFSNTIMNYSLPEVATQYVQSGTITAKVRGTGNVEASDPYNVVAKESRVISSVAVKQGDEVEKGQVIYYLEEKESDELKKAEDELEDLELAYMKGLFGANVSSEIISKVASGNVDGFSTLQAKVTDMQNRIEAAKARVKECQDNVDAITLQSSINANDATVNTIPETNEEIKAKNELEEAMTNETNAEKAFERMKSKKIGQLEAHRTELLQRINDIETFISESKSIAGTTTGEAADFVIALKNAVTDRDNAFSDIRNSAIAGGFSGSDNELLEWVKDKSEYQTLLYTYYQKISIVETTQAKLDNLTGYENYSATLKKLKEELIDTENAIADKQGMTYSPGDSVEEAQKKLNEATQNLTNKTNSNTQVSVANKNRLENANAALKVAQAVLTLLEEEQKQLSSDINAELDLSKASKDIREKEEEIAKLKEKSMGSSITAPMAGTISSLTYVAGETTKPEETAAVLLVEGKGFTLSISVTNEQARKVQVGDTADLQNAWYYDDVKAILSGIKPDKENPGTKKLLVFDVTGTSIQAGQSLSVSVGQRSAEYELVVPNSAIREDNNGKFILIVESKSSPLGNRYIATRVDVEVLASDDKNTAISAGLYGYEYVITTSTKPVEAGKQVRLNES